MLVCRTPHTALMALSALESVMETAELSTRTDGMRIETAAVVVVVVVVVVVAAACLEGGGRPGC